MGAYYYKYTHMHITHSHCRTYLAANYRPPQFWWGQDETPYMHIPDGSSLLVQAVSENGLTTACLIIMPHNSTTGNYHNKILFFIVGDVA